MPHARMSDFSLAQTERSPQKAKKQLQHKQPHKPGRDRALKLCPPTKKGEDILVLFPPCAQERRPMSLFQRAPACL